MQFSTTLVEAAAADDRAAAAISGSSHYLTFGQLTGSANVVF